MATLEFHEAQLQNPCRDTHPGEVVPPEIARLKNWRCVIDSRMVGHCTGDPMSGEIIGLSVVDAYRRQGFGRKLLALVVEALRAAGATRIWVEAPADPSLPAYRFYRAVGWVATGEHTRDGSEILEPRASVHG
jgi:ribosomal protein S18 acetylase RimI-like enzyme